MNFYLVLTKNRKKFDKYSKINKIRNKTVVDIKGMEEEYQISRKEKGSIEYFNLIVYQKITQSLFKKRDVYYIPNFNNKDIDMGDIFKIKKIILPHSDFNLLMFFDEFKNNEDVIQSVLSNMDIFVSSQILKSY